MVEQGVEQLGGSDEIAGLNNEGGINIPGFAEEIEGEFGLSACALDELLVIEPVLVAALFSVGKVLGIDSFASLAEFVEDDMVGQAIIEHPVDQVAGGFGQASNFAVATGGGLWVRDGKGDFGQSGGHNELMVDG